MRVRRRRRAWSPKGEVKRSRVSRQVSVGRQLPVTGLPGQPVEDVEFVAQLQLRQPGRRLSRQRSVISQLPRLTSAGFEGDVGGLDLDDLGLRRQCVVERDVVGADPSPVALGAGGRTCGSIDAGGDLGSDREYPILVDGARRSRRGHRRRGGRVCHSHPDTGATACRGRHQENRRE